MQRANTGSGSESPFERHQPGDVVWLPGGSTWLNRKKSRPFALARECSRTDLATLVYGSTQETEKQSGAVCVAVAPIRQGVNRNGLDFRTFFYPGVLLPVECQELPQRSGILGRSMGELRLQLRNALGIGQGSCLVRGAPRGSRRGRIVLLSPGLAGEVQTPLAVVLTEHEYSRQRNYHVILPIYAGADEESAAHELVMEAQPWMGAFAERPERATLPLPATHSVWYDDDVARETKHVMDEESLARIDRALCDYFSLPDPPPVG